MNLYVRETPSDYTISSPRALFELMKDIGEADQETLWALSLSTKNKVIAKDMISMGAIESASLDMRILFRRVLMHGGSSLILAHNHPSGDSVPSTQDIKLTNKVKEACELLGLKLLDHIIIAGTDYYSFQESGIL